ncbi:uncharacterized protein LOC119174196 isoform X1 [Rhipicephalus microplus]|uniref:uncharacterized protein LOC119174196 isoform X1 n=1 Tax=Rhipicephalus microplus TaxID=6941 RepID=UPI003F6C88EA
MGTPFFTVKTAVLWSLLVIFARENEASEIQRREVLDAFKIYAHLDDVLAVSDINADGVLECVEAVRTEYQTQPKVATYLFLLKGHHGTEKKNVSVHIIPGTTPDKITIYFDNNNEQKFEAQYLYTDYETCAIVKGPYGVERCLLLVSKDKADNVPKSCITNFADLCGVSVNLYSKDLCPEYE